jgi:hypothetical protein
LISLLLPWARIPYIFGIRYHAALSEIVQIIFTQLRKQGKGQVAISGCFSKSSNRMLSVAVDTHDADSPRFLTKAFLVDADRIDPKQSTPVAKS